jgi:hypothetical protein
VSDLSDFFQSISVAKRQQKEELESILGSSFLDDLCETVIVDLKTTKKKEKEQKEKLEVFEHLVEEIVEKISDDQEEELIVEELEEEPELVEQSLGLLAEPSEVKQQKDPLTPLNQNFATLEDLNKHYNLLVNRIQQQLSTLGGGGETRLEFLDDVNRNSVKSDHKFLRYDAPSEKWIGSYAGEGPYISTTTYVTSSAYTITENDYYIGVNYAGAVTITLPTGVVEGTTYIVKDELGEASKGTNRYITVLPSGSDKIDSRDRAILAYNFGSLTFVYRNGWRVV